MNLRSDTAHIPLVATEVASGKRQPGERFGAHSPPVCGSGSARAGETKWLRGYAIALLATAIAFGLRLNLDSTWGDKVPHATFYLAVVATVWFTRTGPAILSTAAGLFLADYFFTSPRYTLGFTTHSEWLSALFFVLVCAGVLVFARRERHSVMSEQRMRLKILTDVKERKRAEIRLDLLAEAANQLLRSREPQYVVNALCQKVMSYLECDVFFNFLVEEGTGGKLRLNAWGGVPDKDARAIEWLEPGTAVCGCAAQEGNRIVAEDIQKGDDLRADLVRGMGLQAYACHPLKVQDRVLGTLSFGTRSRTRFEEDELAMMKAVADMVAIAMERKRAQQELQSINADLEQRVAERTQTLRELAEQLNAFCYTLAHDLRAPLRTQLSFARMLLIDYGDKLGDTGKDWAGRVVQAAERQSNIIQDLLAHITVSRSDLPLEQVELAACVEQAQADLKLELDQKDASVRCDGLNGLRVLANSSSLHLIVLNLLTNAVKFVAPDHKPEVRVRAEPRGEFVRLWVQDNGIGIKEQDLTRLFGAFQRLNRSSDYPGTGLGLAIVKKATERMGGRVGVESQPGEGSRFWVELPAVH